MSKRDIYYKEIPSFISKLIEHLGFSIHIMQVKEMHSLNYEVYSQEEEKVKDYLDTYSYLLSNCSNYLNERIISKSIFLLTGKKINKKKINEILSEFYSIKEEVSIQKIIKYSYLFSLLIRNKKERYGYLLMLMNYLLGYYHYRLIKIMPFEFKELDQVLNKYKKGETKELEDFIIYKESVSKRLHKNYYQELKEIKLIDIISYILENKQILQNKYKITALAIFGSFAKGKEHIDSDIDLIVKFDKYISLMKKKEYTEEIKEMMYQKFKRYCDLHVEEEMANANNIKTFKENIKVI